MNPLKKLPKPIGIVSDKNSPTLFIWLGKYILQDSKDIHLFNFKNKPSIINEDNLKSLILIRKIPPRWVKAVEEFNCNNDNTILLLDDSLLNYQIIKELPLKYRISLWINITRLKNILGKLITELWVSNEEILNQTKHLNNNPNQKIKTKLLNLSPTIKLIENKKVHRIAYLASSSHFIEFRWLYNILEKIQSTRDDCLIEIVADKKIRNTFRKLPRIRIFYPMDFESFLLDTSNRNVDILLVPLLSTPFNKGRSVIKFFDSVRLNAVGLYSNRYPYKDFIRNGIDGILLNDKQDEWIDSINNLLSDSSYKDKLIKNAKERAKKICKTT